MPGPCAYLLRTCTHALQEPRGDGQHTERAAQRSRSPSVSPTARLLVNQGHDARATDGKRTPGSPCCRMMLGLALLAIPVVTGIVAARAEAAVRDRQDIVNHHCYLVYRGVLE